MFPKNKVSSYALIKPVFLNDQPQHLTKKENNNSLSAVFVVIVPLCVKFWLNKFYTLAWKFLQLTFNLHFFSSAHDQPTQSVDVRNLYILTWPLFRHRRIWSYAIEPISWRLLMPRFGCLLRHFMGPVASCRKCFNLENPISNCRQGSRKKSEENTSRTYLKEAKKFSVW